MVGETCPNGARITSRAALFPPASSARCALFDGAIAWTAVRFNLAPSGEVQLVEGLLVSGDDLRVLGVPASLGRTFTAADDLRGGGPDGPVAVISHAFWQRHYPGRCPHR